MNMNLQNHLTEFTYNKMANLCHGDADFTVALMEVTQVCDYLGMRRGIFFGATAATIGVIGTAIAMKIHEKTKSKEES